MNLSNCLTGVYTQRLTGRGIEVRDRTSFYKVNSEPLARGHVNMELVLRVWTVIWAPAVKSALNGYLRIVHPPLLPLCLYSVKFMGITVFLTNSESLLELP